MRRLEPTSPIHTFTGRFPGEPTDEGRFAHAVVDLVGSKHSETTPTAERFMREAPRLYWHADFPIGGMSQFAQYCVFGLAKEAGVTVLLDGQGADEQLGGYGNTITRAFLSQLLDEGRLWAFATERARHARNAPNTFGLARFLFESSPLQRLRPILRRATGRGHVTRSHLLCTGAVTRLAQRPADTRNLSSVLWNLSFRTMLSSLLRFGDRLSMAHSREVRLPFCDHRLTEFVFTLSPDLLLGDGQVKRVLRMAAAGLVPSSVLERPKQGFVPPQTQWLVGPLTEWLTRLADEPGPLEPHLSMSHIRTLVRAPALERKRDASALWDSANLLAWSRFALEPIQRLPAMSVTAPSGDGDDFRSRPPDLKAHP